MQAADRIRELFDLSIETKRRASRTMPAAIARAADGVVACVKSGGKILACGNGGSAADAQHFASEFINRFERDRPALAAMALTTDASTTTSIANDFAFERIFSRQIEALGRAGDMLLAFTTSGNSANVVAAIETARRHGLRVLLISGRDGGRAASALGEDDFELRVPAQSTARIQEVHLLLIHCICDHVDTALDAAGETPSP